MLDLGFIEIELGGAHFLGVETPIPRLDLDVDAFTCGHRLQFRKLGLCAGDARRPHPFQQLADVGRCLRHCFFERVVGVSSVAQQVGDFNPQFDEIGNRLPVVGWARGLAARGPGFPGLLA